MRSIRRCRAGRFTRGVVRLRATREQTLSSASGACVSAAQSEDSATGSERRAIESAGVVVVSANRLTDVAETTADAAMLSRESSSRESMSKTSGSIGSAAGGAHNRPTQSSMWSMSKGFGT